MDHPSLLDLHVPWQNKTTAQGTGPFAGAWLYHLPLVERSHQGRWAGPVDWAAEGNQGVVYDLLHGATTVLEK